MTCNKFLQNRPKKRNPTQKQPTDSSLFFLVFCFGGPLLVADPPWTLASGLGLWHQVDLPGPYFFALGAKAGSIAALCAVQGGKPHLPSERLLGVDSTCRQKFVHSTY
jgi:hypothetical protein